jgi:hypothetical protein
MIDDLMHTPGSSESAETSRSITPIDGSGNGARLLSRGQHAGDGEAAASSSPAPTRPVRLLVPSASDPTSSARRPSLTPSEAETRTYADDADVMYQDRLANGFRYHTHAREVRILRAHDLPEPLDLFALLGDLSAPSTPVIVVSAASPTPVSAA